MRTPPRRSKVLRAPSVSFALLLAACFACEPSSFADDPAPEADPAGAKQSLNPEEIVSEARQRLAAHSTIQLKITQTTHFRDRATRARGRYLQGTNLRSRLEFALRVGQVEGRLLQVCDGEDLWTRYDVGSDTRLTLRNVRRILQAARTRGLTGEQLVKAELGMGGLPEMLRAIDESTDFDHIEKRDVDGETIYVVEGGWSEEFAKSFGNPAIQQFVPDRVRIDFDARLFPRRIVYSRKQDEGEGRQPLVSLDFENPVLGEPIDDAEFEWVSPTGIFPRDLTDQYIQRLQPPAAPAAGG